MNTPLDHEPEEDLRFAEYVLGVLDAGERAEVEREIEADPVAAAEVARWQRHLFPLTDEIAPQTPDGNVWVRIQGGLAEKPAHPRSAAVARGGWWSSLPLWRGLAAGAAAVAVAFIIAFIVVPRTSVRPRPAPSIAYMASTIAQDNGQVGWVATMDLQHARMVVVPARPQTLPGGRAAELWLIPQGQKPVAVGMIDTHAPTTLAIDTALVKRLGSTSALAVSVEPPGGSPTGQPTGPVIAKGAIGAVVQSKAG